MAGLRLHATAAMLAVLVCCVVWLVVGVSAGAWHPWPVWPALGAGVGDAGHWLVLRAILTPGH